MHLFASAVPALPACACALKLLLYFVKTVLLITSGVHWVLGFSWGATRRQKQTFCISLHTQAQTGSPLEVRTLCFLLSLLAICYNKVMVDGGWQTFLQMKPSEGKSA